MIEFRIPNWMRMIGLWWTHKARWYQFWYPQSGLFGGIIGGVIVGTVIKLIF